MSAGARSREVFALNIHGPVWPPSRSRVFRCCEGQLSPTAHTIRIQTAPAHRAGILSTAQVTRRDLGRSEALSPVEPEAGLKPDRVHAKETLRAQSRRDVLIIFYFICLQKMK